MNDLELHNIVRDSLKDLQPDYNPGHWQLMRFKLITAQLVWPLKLLAPAAVTTAAVGTLLFSGQDTQVDNVPFTSLNLLDQKEPVELPYEGPMIKRNMIPLVPITPIEIEQEPKQDSNLSNLEPHSLELSSFINKPSTMRTFFLEREITTLLKGNVIDKDSTTYKVLERNKGKWQNSVVVCDWTSSMFRYGTQIFAWLNNNRNNQGLKGYVFFNDCDAEGKPLGAQSVGAMYHTTSKNPDHVLNTMITAVRKGLDNTDLRENDLEAIQFAINKYPLAQEIILIADNRSPVRWPHRMQSIDRPVRIILCGPTITGEAIQQDYIDLARATGGSIHTMEDDLDDVINIPKGKWLKVDNTYYKYQPKKDAFVPTFRKKRPKKDLTNL